MTTEHTLEEAQERAALYALGAMPQEEAVSFEAHLRRGCEECTRELASFGAVVDELAAAATLESPGNSVRAALLERIATPVFYEEGVRFVRGPQMDWLAGTLPWIERKTLFSDQKRGYHTQIVRLSAGTTIPPHRHTEAEEIYILEGDLSVSGVTMTAGDYCRAEAGTVHNLTTTRDGCVFLVLHSEHDPILA